MKRTSWLLAFLLILGWVLWAFLSPPAGAFTPPPPPDGRALDDLADYVVEGRVERVTSYWDEERATIYTLVTLRVTRTLKAYVPPVLTIRHLGGEVDGMGLIVSSEPQFAVGEEVRVYLRRRPDGTMGVLWGSEGKVHLGGTRFEPAYVYEGKHWYDEDLPVPYWINAAGSEDIPDDSEFTAIRNALQTWNDVACSYFAFADQGLTSERPSAYAEYDQDNIIGWMSREEWGGSISPNTLAVNQYWYIDDRIVAFDIVFFEEHDWGTAGEPDRFDVQSVALHEAGHALSLGHTDIPEAVMYPYIAAGQIKRTLHQDDIDGICAIYPRPSLIVSPTLIAFLQDEATDEIRLPSHAVSIQGSGSWTSTVDVPWIERTPEAGVAPSTMEVSVVGTEEFATGVYTGTIEITDGAGETSTVTVRLVVEEIKEVYLPLVVRSSNP